MAYEPQFRIRPRLLLLVERVAAVSAGWAAAASGRALSGLGIISGLGPGARPRAITLRPVGADTRSRTKEVKP